jgi:hypothetical protein
VSILEVISKYDTQEQEIQLSGRVLEALGLIPRNSLPTPPKSLTLIVSSTISKKEEIAVTEFQMSREKRLF